MISLQFRKFITPLAIQIIFWIRAAASVISGIGLIIAGARFRVSCNNAEGGMPVMPMGPMLPPGLTIFGGLLQIFLGPVIVRIWCELIMLFFRIYDTLQEIPRRRQG